MGQGLRDRYRMKIKTGEGYLRLMEHCSKGNRQVLGILICASAETLKPSRKGHTNALWALKDFSHMAYNNFLHVPSL